MIFSDTVLTTDDLQSGDELGDSRMHRLRKVRHRIAAASGQLVCVQGVARCLQLRPALITT